MILKKLTKHRMKKLILSLALVIGMMTFAKAQDFAGRIKGPVTLTNAVSDTTEVTVSGSRSAITFKYDISKTSGTIAGTIVLQYKLSTVSGEQWFTYNSYTLTDATATNVVSIAYNPAVYWRIIIAKTGTSVSVHNNYLLYRK